MQRSNCHPFRYGRWLWMHNGSLAEFGEVKRDLLMAVDPSLYPEIEGSTDTETLFFLALTFGLTEDPPNAVARAVGLVEEVGRRHGVEYPVHMTVAASDGESIWVFRYSSEKSTSSLYYSTDIAQVRQLYPELAVLNELGDDTRFIVSEPLRDLPGAWNEVPESSWASFGRASSRSSRSSPRSCRERLAVTVRRTAHGDNGGLADHGGVVPVGRHFRSARAGRPDGPDRLHGGRGGAGRRRCGPRTIGARRSSPSSRSLLSGCCSPTLPASGCISSVATSGSACGCSPSACP